MPDTTAPFDVESHLADRHAMYGHFRQDERSSTRFMADNGHPDAGAYEKLRAFFDTLRFACNSSARLYTFADPGNQAQYWAPSLTVSWRPRGLPGIGHVYPALGEPWDMYLKVAAAAGWPEGVEPRLRPGSWVIKTQDDALIAALRDLGEEGSASRGSDSGYGSDFDCVSFQIFLEDPAHFEAIRRVVDRYQGDHVLPARSDADDRADRAPIPLAEKPVLLGNVDCVTETDHQVLLPLIPAGPGGTDAALAILDGLVDLVDQGLPWSGARPWLERHLKPDAYMRLAKRFAQGDT